MIITIIMVNIESRGRLGSLPVFFHFILKEHNRHTLHSTYTDEGTYRSQGPRDHNSKVWI